MKVPTKTAGRSAQPTVRNVLPVMRRLGRQGLYREAIRAFLSLPFDDRGTRMSGRRTELYLQYAIALQHAGLFGLAKEVYERVETSAAALRDSAASAAAVYNARVQLAVLQERFGEPSRALALLDRIGPASARDLRLARASLQSWISITRMKCLLALKRRKELRCVAGSLLQRGDWNERIWARLFTAILNYHSSSALRRRAADAEIRESIARMTEADISGAPWTALLAGQHVPDARAARGFLENAHREASRLGKFFVIAESAELLAQNRYAGAAREWYLRRAINAYARCGLLLLLPFSQRLFRAASDRWDSRTAEQAILQSAHLLESRESLVFSAMCTALAGRKGFGVHPWEVFEDFVRDWAMARYPGEYKHIVKGEATADAMIVQKNGTVVLQAKHVRSARHEIPDTIYFRELHQNHDIPPVKRYVFVVTSSSPTGWSDDLWSVGLTKKLMNKFIESNIKVDVVTEPELQTDVLLDDYLYDKYFGANQSDVR